MRQIIFLFCLFLSLSTFTFSLRAENLLNYEMGLEQQQDKQQMINGEPQKIEKKITALTLTLEEFLSFLPALSLTSTLRLEKPDYSSVVIRGRNPQTGEPDSERDTTLDKTNQNTEQELLFTAAATIAKGPHSATLGASRNLTRSPYASSNINANYIFGLYNQTSLLGIGASYTKRKAPQNYFTDVDHSFKPRPSTIHDRSLNTSVEQVLSERAKAKLFFTRTFANQERPSNYSIGPRLAYAFTDTLYGKLGYRFTEEQRSGSNNQLKNERGYYTQHIVESEITIEPIYDLLLSLSYDFIMEDETDPREGTKKRLGVDQYGLGFRYDWSTFSALSRTSYLRSNQQQSALNIYGGLEWPL